MKRTRMRRMSSRRRKELDEYLRLRAEWIVGKRCRICNSTSVEVHHSNGRHGKRLLAVEDWVPLCANHHDRITNDPRLGMALGVTKVRRDQV